MASHPTSLASLEGQAGAGETLGVWAPRKGHGKTEAGQASACRTERPRTTQPCGPLAPGLPASRTVRTCISWLRSPCRWLLCEDSWTRPKSTYHHCRLPTSLRPMGSCG